mmetsp:Transcript_19933/g.64704  ORF Transcript_19933/g.64704 Transcript_19933/m.64704 type:complete len:283 (-) Transcript_19933:387-1235(-)
MVIHAPHGSHTPFGLSVGWADGLMTLATATSPIPTPPRRSRGSATACITPAEPIPGRRSDPKRSKSRNATNSAEVSTPNAREQDRTVNPRKRCMPCVGPARGAEPMRPVIASAQATGGATPKRGGEGPSSGSAHRWPGLSSDRLHANGSRLVATGQQGRLVTLAGAWSLPCSGLPVEGVSAKSKLTISSSETLDGREALGRIKPIRCAALNNAVGDGDLQGSISVARSSSAEDASARTRGFEGRPAAPIKKSARAAGRRVAGIGEVLSCVSSSSLASDSLSP